MARPNVTIDWDMVDEMLIAGSPTTEIADCLGMCPDTLYLRCQREKGVGFSAYSQQKRSKGEKNLRMKQYEMAMAGDRGMLIWLGKNRLKQSDKHDVSHTGNAPVTVVNFSDKPQKPWKEEQKKNEQE
jgi:hypothetical protein